jgi:hypothetical protein
VLGSILGGLLPDGMDGPLDAGLQASTKLGAPACYLPLLATFPEDTLGDSIQPAFTNANRARSWPFVKSDKLALAHGMERSPGWRRIPQPECSIQQLFPEFCQSLSMSEQGFFEER